MDRDRILDKYTFRARLAPSLIVALPVGLLVVGCFPDALVGWSLIWGIVSWAGGAILLSQIGRDMGVRKESTLFQLWGGKPTSKLLRHSESSNAITLSRRHKAIGALLKDITMPTPEEEKANPGKADEIYEAGITILRERTRDRNKFGLVFEENCNYGFRRNLWAMKPIGLIIAVGSLVGILAFVIWGRVLFGQGDIALPALAGGVITLLAACWIVVFTADWVRIAAGAYAERLLECSEQIVQQ